MSVQDFRFYQSLSGEPDMQSFAVSGSSTFAAGEPVVLTSVGVISECGDDPPSVIGIAAHRSTDVKGTSFTVGHPVTVYRTTPGQIFITRNFATGGGGVAVTPQITDIGDLAGFDFSNGVDWFLDTGQDNENFIIVGVQDAMGNNLADPRVLPGTGVWVLFTIA